MTKLSFPIAVAPMMDWTDRHDRYFLRLISPHARLYTEMVTSGAILHGDRDRLLAFDEAEHPVALQLGGSDANELAQSAAIGQAFGYDEINLNVGCPSDRVQAGCFGAALMGEPQTVAACMAAMQAAVDIPVTVKHRLGIDDRAEWDDLKRFVETVAEAGVRQFIVHARAAWLQGVSPKDNREVPPLRYELVYRLKETFPELVVWLNGGVADMEAARGHLDHVDGVMLGRAAYQNPYILSEITNEIDGTPPPVREDIIRRLMPYVDRELARGTRLQAITRHILGLFNGRRGARAWRRHLSENAVKPGADAQVIRDALAHVADHTSAHAA
ncbi:MAG: tRNA dihydrouridine(20/20a) synthase DusA [Alphaproteobacteria bacterium]|nr:tRNA dihydrouridine(20/20a) synthase DusA [Alphaproteobacteria bacterium]